MKPYEAGLKRIIRRAYLRQEKGTIHYGRNNGNQRTVIYRNVDIRIFCLDLRLAPLQATQRTRATYPKTR